jgi:hypothetical protein
MGCWVTLFLFLFDYILPYIMRRVLFPVFALAVASGVPSDASYLAAADTDSTVADASGDANVPKLFKNVSGHCGAAYLVSPQPTIQRDEPTELAIILLPEQDGDPNSNGLFTKMVNVSARLGGKRRQY